MKCHCCKTNAHAFTACPNVRMPETVSEPFDAASDGMDTCLDCIGMKAGNCTRQKAAGFLGESYPVAMGALKAVPQRCPGFAPARPPAKPPTPQQRSAACPA